VTARRRAGFACLLRRRFPLAPLALCLGLLIPGTARGDRGQGDPVPPGEAVRRPLALEEALSLAGGHADLLALGRRSLVRASLALREARARLGPVLTFSASGAYLTNPPAISVPAGALGSFDLPPPLPPLTLPEEEVEFREIAGNTWFQLDLELRQPLFTWLKLRNAVKLAELTREIAAVDLQDAQRRVRKETAGSYYLAVLARESAERLERMTRILREIEADRAEAYELGATTVQGLLEVRARSAEAEQRLLEARESGATALASLGYFTGADAADRSLVSGLPPQGGVPEEAELVRAGQARSPTLQKLRLQTEQAGRDAARIRGGGTFRPDAGLSVALEVTGQELPGSGAGWADTWDANLTVGLGVEGSLFDSGRGRWQDAAAGEAVEAAREALAMATTELQLSVRRAMQELRVAAAGVRAGEAALEEKSEAERSAGEAFAEDLLTREQLGLARLERLRAELNLLRARHGYATALVELQYLSGMSF
jgi:outer membrane protein